MNERIKILHLEDSGSDVKLIHRVLQKAGLSFELSVVETEKDFTRALKNFCPDVILSDHSLPSFNSHDALAIYQQSGLKIPFIIVTSTMTDEFAADIIKKGANDYILKDRLNRLPSTIQNLIEKFRLERERHELYNQSIRNEKYFRAVLENTADGIAVLTSEGNPVYLSPSIKNILGYTIEEGMQLNLLGLAHPDDVPDLKDWLKQVMNNPGMPVSGNPVRIMHKDGNWRWIKGVLTNMLHDPYINGIVDNYRDVTEKVLAEKVLKDSEEKYRSFFENNVDGILITVTDGSILAANPAACRMFRMTEAEICKLGRLGLIDPTDPRVQHAIEERKKHGKVKAELTFVRKDGTKFPGEIDCTVFKMSNAEERTSMIIRDLTEAKKAQKAILELESNLQSIFDNTSEGYILTDTNGVIKTFNSKAKEFVFKNTESEVKVGDSIFDFIDDDRKQNFTDLISKVLLGETINYDHCYQRNGKLTWVNFTLNPVLISGNIEGICITGTDITERKKAEEENRFKANLLNTIGQAAIATDINGIVNYWNHAAENIYGWTKEEALGKLITDLTPSEATTEQALQIMEDLKKGQTWSGEFMVRKKDGTNFPAMVNNTPIYNEHNVLSGIIGVSSDITEKKKLQQLFDKATKLAVIGSYELDLVTNTLYWSSITKEIHEVEENFIPDLNTAINFYKEGLSRETISVSLQKAIEEGVPFDVELVIVTAKGNERWVRAIGDAEFVNGKCIKLTGSFQDIDKRKNAELQILNAYKEKNIILESIGDAFFAVDKNWTITYWNKHAEKVLSKKREELINRNLWEVFPDAIDTPFYTHYHKSVAENIVQNFEAYYPSLEAWYEVSAYPGHNGLSVYFRDITKRKLSDIQVKRLNNELQKNIQDLATSNRELEDFAYVASHDLQEPLRMVTNFLGLLEKKYSAIIDDKGKQYIHFAVDGAKRMRQIILDLLEFSRVGRGHEKEELIDVNEVVRNVILLFQKQTNETRAIITCEQLPSVKSYQTPLRQLFQNLISNAIKYRKKEEPPFIKISAEEKTTGWQFSIKDNGIGIEEEYFKKIFVIFQRLHNKDEYSGTGLGLAICKKIIDNLGGKIWVESEPDKGSTFYFTLPKNLSQDITGESNLLHFEKIEI